MPEAFLPKQENKSFKYELRGQDEERTLTCCDVISVSHMELVEERPFQQFNFMIKIFLIQRDFK